MEELQLLLACISLTGNLCCSTCRFTTENLNRSKVAYIMYEWDCRVWNKITWYKKFKLLCNLFCTHFVYHFVTAHSFEFKHISSSSSTMKILKNTSGLHLTFISYGYEIGIASDLLFRRFTSRFHNLSYLCITQGNVNIDSV